MSLIQRATLDDSLTIIAILGAGLIAGSLIFLVIGSMIYQNWLLIGLNMVFGPLVVGLITLFISVKVMEILK